jgi:hypothetical protein
MLEYFKAGGFGMFPVTLFGLASLVVGLLAVRRPTPGRMAALRNLPSLVMASALIGFGTGLWSVGTHLNDEAFVKALQISGDQLPLVAWMGMGESAANLVLGAMFVLFTIILRMITEVKLAKAGVPQA